MDVCLGDLAHRHFRPDFKGTKISSHDPIGFVWALRALLEGDLRGFTFPRDSMITDPVFVTAPGYAPFCQHLFVRNFTDAKLSIANVVPETEHLLRSGYQARRPEELAVLTRWFEREDLLKLGWEDTCDWLDLILYSKEQMAKEGQPVDSDWAIVSINSAFEPCEAPMPPITMMRNALGIEEGGSGVPLNRAAYEASVQYWSRYALVR